MIYMCRLFKLKLKTRLFIHKHCEKDVAITVYRHMNIFLSLLNFFFQEYRAEMFHFTRSTGLLGLLKIHISFDITKLQHK